MKYLLIIGDGMADNALESLKGQTPLEVAEIPEMDALASRGTIGSVKTVPDGFAPGSDTAIMSIFGCAPAKYFAGRAPLEAAAQGVFLEEGDAAFRCNISAISEGEAFEERKMLSHSAGGIGGDEARALVEDLCKHEGFRQKAEEAGITIWPDNSYRHLAVQKATDIKGITLHAPHENLNARVGDILPGGCEAAAALTELMELACEVLEEHPINVARRASGKLPGNVIWFWAEGTAAALPDFQLQYRKSGAVVSAVPLVQGIAHLTGLNVILVPGATAEIDTNYEGKVKAAIAALETRDFAAIHVEAPDECSHNGDLEGKIKAIELIDSRVVGPVVRALKKFKEFRILLLSDHKTLLDSGQHNGDPVPYLIYDSRRDSGSGMPYTEQNGEKGVYIDDGTRLMELLFEIDR